MYVTAKTDDGLWLFLSRNIEETLMPNMDEFLKKARWSSGGSTCQTCKHVRSKEIDRACDEFISHRAAGKTTMPWSVFLRHFLRKELNYTLQYNSLRHHMEKCRDKTL